VTEPRPRAPTDQEKSDLDAFQVKQNERVHKSLGVWQAGFAAVVAAASGGLTIAALDRMDKAGDGWRWVLAVLVIAGTIVGILAEMIALRTEVGTARYVEQRSVILARGGVLAFETRLADAAGRQLHKSQRWGAASLALLLAALAVLWLAPPSSQAPNLLVEHGTEQTCGKLLSADGGTLRLEVEGAHDPAAISFDQVDNLRIVHDCP
jgi:MFS family permease